jgi:hypothetical protein
LVQIITKYDKSNKGGLFLEEFKEFFIRASVENNSMIWRIIHLSGYKNNLKHNSEPDLIVKEDVLPRKILSNRDVYGIIFEVLANDVFQPVHMNFYRLLSMLETDHQLCRDIKNNIPDFFAN